MSAPIRVLIVDDSSYVRLVLKRMLGQSNGIEVVGMAEDGQQALRLAAQLKPDVITLDVEMPRLSGLEVLKRLLPRNPIPVIMLSSLTQRGAQITLDALELGAVDFVGKPGSASVPDLKAVQRQLITKIRVASRAKVVPPGSASARLIKHRVLKRTSLTCSPVVLIGSSTGGPHTLHSLFSRLPEHLPACIALTQHMPSAFTEALAMRLDQCSPLQVRQAAEGDLLQPGRALLAPGDYHMIIGPQGILHLSHDPPVCGVRPAANPMMISAAHNLRTPLVAVVLTGMGTDGADGAVAVKQAGGTVIAQDEYSSVIYGMPRAVAETGVCDHIAALSDLPDLLVRVVGRLATTPATGVTPQTGG